METKFNVVVTRANSDYKDVITTFELIGVSKAKAFAKARELVAEVSPRAGHDYFWPDVRVRKFGTGEEIKFPMPSRKNTSKLRGAR